MDTAPVEWHRSAAEMLRASHLAEASEIVDMINDAARPVGVEINVYLVDREQQELRALPRTTVPSPAPLPIATTVAGRCFMTVEPVTLPGQRDFLWAPIIDGSDRIGVVELALPPGLDPDDPQVRAGTELFTSVIGYVVVAKAAYGDTIRRARRSRPMSIGGELLWRALPPLTLATADLRLAAALEPCYEVGGDAFDYAVDHQLLHVGVFDAIGHGLTAALTSTLTLAATRAARTAGRDLAAMAHAADEAITGQFHDTRYTTAILAELNARTGEVRYLNAGHPPAVLMRSGKAVALLDAARRTPLGVPAASEPASYELQPGDRLLCYTDGITEARDAQGEFFGLTRLLDLAERNAASGMPAAEVLRRLTHAVLAHQGGQLADDATLLIVEWSPGGVAPGSGTGIPG